MLRRLALAVALATLAASCGRGPTDAPPARAPAGAAWDGDPPPPDSGQTPTDTTGRGGGTLGSGT